MKRAILVLIVLGLGSPAYAQFGGLLHKAEQIQKAKQQFDDLNITEAEEIQIGQQVSAKIRQRFGVVQDPAVTKYVTEVGLLLAKASDRPNLPWQFIVLDTDGVNAFAAPGGIIHITRGALGLIHNEAELAGVLGHEVTHVAHKHTVNAIRKQKLVQLGTDQTLKNRNEFIGLLADKTYSMVLENAFDRGDELDADKGGVALTKKVGYAPAGLAEFLTRLDERNRDMPTRNGLFASHPDTQERIEKVRALAGSSTGALVAARYAQNVSYTATPITRIATIVEGSAGLAGGSGSGSSQASGNEKSTQAPPPQKKKKKKKGFGLANLTGGTAPESQTAQVSASGGARGVGPDRNAKGGSNPNVVKVTVTAAELAAFKAGIQG